MSEANYHYLFKFIIVGDTFVGKSNILSMYTYNRFIQDHEPTVGSEFMSKNIVVNERNIRVQIWDTAGQEAFRSLTRSYFKNSACAMIVYSINEKKSFQNIGNWLEDCREICPKDTLVLLIGNKKDLEDKRAVTYAEADTFAKENGLFFFETSAFKGEGIEEAFKFATEELVTRLESGKMDWDINSSGIKIGKFPNKKIEEMMDNPKKGCC